jgi:outer membrane immunogenic protein
MKIAYSLMAGAALAVTLASGAAAADLLLGPADPIYSSQLYNFEGLYAGVTGGGAVSGGGLAGTLGVVVGANFAVTDGIIAGAEFQGTTYWTGGGYAAYDMLALGRVGGFLSDNTMIYGALGGGLNNGAGAYAFGGGVEMALADNFAVRGELMGLGNFGAGPSTGKATVGLLMRFN